MFNKIQELCCHTKNLKNYANFSADFNHLKQIIKDESGLNLKKKTHKRYDSVMSSKYGRKMSPFNARTYGNEL